MPSVTGLIKPAYLFRPIQLVRRLRVAISRGLPRTFVVVRLPWGVSIRCRPADGIGSALVKLGVFELHVSEALWRLLEDGETAIDAGANIGYMTSLMATRVGRAGRVMAIEPHPEIAMELRANVALWKTSDVASVDVEECALSDGDGDGVLEIPQFFASNRGTASLSYASHPWHGEFSQAVRLAKLDTLMFRGASLAPIGLLKMDVEWHEVEALRGAEELLRSQLLRDIVYEDHRGPNSAAAQWLRSHGYTLFAISSSFWGPRLIELAAREATSALGSPDFLATLAPDRARRLLRPRGWQVLRENTRRP